jgi:hypothetical protein
MRLIRSKKIRVNFPLIDKSYLQLLLLTVAKHLSCKRDDIT